jgi:hypothetical protein
MLNAEGQTQTPRLTSGGYLATVPSQFLRPRYAEIFPEEFRGYSA